jgi:hypothetical protein
MIVKESSFKSKHPFERIVQNNQYDTMGRPSGGAASGVGFNIKWQDGPIGFDDEPNGAFVEDVIAAVIGRLYFYQDSSFKCRENAIAITKLEEALLWLEERTRQRRQRGVEGTHIV